MAGAAQRGETSHAASPGVSPARHLVLGGGLLVALAAIGTVGYVAIAGMSVLDALYMTVTTLSTVGYGEIRPLGPGGRIFTMGLIVAGVGTALYTAGALAEFLVAGRLQELLGRRAMSRTLASMGEHVIVCGYGRLGRALAAELDRGGVPQVVIEEDPSVAARLEGGPHPVIVASAAEDGVLEQAGVARARAIVAATGSEAVNVFVTLAAREANPVVAIHARAETEAGARQLRRAGATQVVSPHHLGGLRLAHAILRPAVVDFMELAMPGQGDREIDLEEVALAHGSPLVGVRLRDLPARGIAVLVVAIKRVAQPIALSPGADAELRPGDRVVVVGERENLMRLGDLAGRGGSAAS